MDKLIKWLFQSTADGATYLQVIIIFTLLILLFYVFLRHVTKIVDLLKDEGCDSDEDGKKV